MKQVGFPAMMLLKRSTVGQHSKCMARSIRGKTANGSPSFPAYIPQRQEENFVQWSLCTKNRVRGLERASFSKS